MVSVTLTFGKTPASVKQLVWDDSVDGGDDVTSTSLAPASAISLTVTDRLMDIVID